MIWAWRTVALVTFLVSALGLFWFAQGAGLITVDPILCTGDCEPVRAPSSQWQITGGITAIIGITLGTLAVHRARTRRRNELKNASPASQASVTRREQT